MNNRTQQKFDKSVREAAKASGQAAANDRAVKASWRHMERAMRMPEKMANGASGKELDDLVARLVERDNLQAE